MTGEHGSKGGVAAAAGVGVLALLGGIGKFLLNSGDDIARVAIQSGDDIARVAAQSGDDLARGAGGAFRHADQAGGQFARNLGSGVDDFARAAPRFADDLPAAAGHLPGGPLARPFEGTLTAADDVVAQQARFADSLGALSEAGQSTARSTARANASALADLMQRTQRGRAQLAEQVAALSKLKTGNQAVDPRIVAQVVAKEHDRSLQLLAKVQVTLEQTPPARLAELAGEARPTAVSAADVAGPAAARQASIVELTAETRRLSAHDGAHWLKALLKLGEQQFRDQGQPGELDGELDAPPDQLSDARLSTLRRNLGETLSAAEAELNGIESALGNEQQILEHAAQLTRLRIELFHAFRTADRFANQLGREVGPQN